MGQDLQVKKAKKFRVLKVLFYFLSFPLFIFVTLLASIKYMGRDPFVGTHIYNISLVDTQLFNHAQEAISAPALYGLWVVCAIWLVVSIFHIIMTKVCKNRRARMFLVIAFTLVAMLGSMLIMDYTMSANIDSMIKDVEAGKYAEGVTVDDYKTQLSYYRTLTSDIEKKSMYLNLIKEVERLEDVYNVDMYGKDKGGVSGNIGNSVVYYDELIADDGTVGVDISYKDGYLNLEEKNSRTVGKAGLLSDNSLAVVDDNIIPDDGDDTNDHMLVRLKPNANGQLVINGTVYSHYFYQKKAPKTGSEKTIFVWYNVDLMPIHTTTDTAGVYDVVYGDGIYGKAVYNPNGMLSDGWVPSLYNVLEILEDYYSCEGIVNDIIKKNDLTYTYDDWHSSILIDATQRMKDYYMGNIPDENGEMCSDYYQALYAQEVTTGKFSLTRGEIDALLAEVGALLGNNGLFDALLKADDSTTIGGIINPILTQLAAGMDLGASMDPGVFTTIGSIIGKTVTGLVLVVKYVDASGNGNLFVGLKNSTDPAVEDYWLDLNFSDEILGKDLVFIYKNALGEDVDNIDYAFDLDHVSLLLSNVLTNVLTKATLIEKDLDGDSVAEPVTIAEVIDNLLTDGTLGTILGLVGGLLDGFDLSSADGLFASLANLIDSKLGGYGAISYTSAGGFKLDIVGFLSEFLQTLYYYQTPGIKAVYEFYPDYDTMDAEEIKAAKAYADMDRAYFMGAKYGNMMGSTMIGDSLGWEGALEKPYVYTADFGLADLASVQQLKLDLSYKPVYYPLFTARDMIMLFGGLVILFYFLSFVASEREIEFAEGKAIVPEKKKKAKKNKKETSEDNIVADNASTSAADDTVEESANKEENISLEEVAETPASGAAEDTAPQVEEESKKEVGEDE